MVNRIITEECKRQGVTVAPFISSRVTQTYDTGACVYTYFGFMYRGMENPVEAFTAIESAARDEIIRHNGSISIIMVLVNIVKNGCVKQYRTLV